MTFTALVCATLFSCSKDKDDPAAPIISGTPCTYTVGEWSNWSNGVRTRTVSASPDGCVGTMPAATETHWCMGANGGWLTIYNVSTNPYQVTITGPSTIPSFTMNGGTVRDSIYVGNGTYGLHSLQLSGYAIFPSEFNATRTVGSCNVQTWTFP